MLSANDWPLIKEAIQIAENLFVSAAAIITVVLAYLGLEAWKRELRGRTAFDTGLTLSILVKKIGVEVQRCRSPAVHPNEWGTGDDCPSVIGWPKAYVYVYNRRTAAVWELQLKINEAAIQAEVLWGADVRAAIEQLRQLTNELLRSIEVFIEDKLHGGVPFRDSPLLGERTMEVVYGRASSSDDYSQRLQSAIERICTLIRPHLES